MQLTNSLPWLSSLGFILFSVVIQAAPATCCSKEFVFTDEHRKNMMLSYMAIWNGDFSNVNGTLMQDLDFHMDRHPTADGTEPTVIKKPQEFMELVGWSHDGWESLELSPLYHVGQENRVALRWKHLAVMGPNFTKVNTTLKPGDEVIYYGNDFLTLDSCTGKVSGIHMAQDLLTFFYDLGVRMLPL